MNLCCLIGRLIRDPIVRFEGESQTASFTLAVQEPGRTGTAFTLFVPCTSWGRSAEACSLLTSADLVSIEGKLTWRKQVGKCKQEHAQLCVNVREITVLAPVATTVGSSN